MGLNWLDCPYQKGKCSSGKGWPCKMGDTTEEERLRNSTECPYLLRYEEKDEKEAI